jgi:hypothetical protein
MFCFGFFDDHGQAQRLQAYTSERAAVGVQASSLSLSRLCVFEEVEPEFRACDLGCLFFLRNERSFDRRRMMRANLRQGLTSPTYLLVWVLLVTISSLDPYVKAAQECVVEADGSENCSEVGNDEIEECVDALPGDKCEMLVSYEGCINDFSNLRKQCAATCLLCGDTLTEEELLHGNGEPFYLDRIFSEDPQRVEGDYRKDTYRRLLDVEQYMYNTIYVEEEFTSIKEDCQMKSELCTFWAMTVSFRLFSSPRSLDSPRLSLTHPPS